MTPSRQSDSATIPGQTSFGEDSVVRVDYGDEPHQLSHRPADWTCVVCGTSDGVAGWPRRCWDHKNVPTRYVGDRQRNAEAALHGRCAECGAPLPPPAQRRSAGGNRPREFCSNRCRQRAYRQRAKKG